VAIPTLNAGPAFADTLAAVRAQRIDGQLQVVICDSSSTDDTVALARAGGAHVIEIPGSEFSHGGTRNLLMSNAEGDHVAFLTQDAVPENEHWLAGLLNAFTLAPNVGLAFGPYRPRADASPSVARELTAWFGSLSGDGPSVDVLEPAMRSAPPRSFLGRLGFFTDANGCVARKAWQQVPFRHVAYAEDHLLAQDMLRAGFAKVYVPEAGVIHSHEYSAYEWLRRSFDESRAMAEVYGWVPGLRTLARNFRGNVKADWDWPGDARAVGGATTTRDRASRLGASILHHGARSAGSLMGSYAGRLPSPLVARLSLEGRR
jgi:glycosyltransferase involved in cell wall biosynthesis